MSETPPEPVPSEATGQARLAPKFSHTNAGQVVVALVIIIVIGAVVAVGILVGGSRTTAVGQSADASLAEEPPARSSEDPIEQARVVLGGVYTYEQVRTATDAALSATSTEISSDNYSRAWSSVLAVTNDVDAQPMDVMLCVPDLASAGAGLTFPQVVALCVTEISVR